MIRNPDPELRVRMPRALQSRARKVARKMERSLSWLVREAIERYCDRAETGAPRDHEEEHVA